MKGSREILIPLAVFAAALFATRALACDPPANEKMGRQIGVMEKIVNQVLVDSPNFFVQERENCRGMYVKGVGLVFSYSASLVEKDWDLDKIFKWGDIKIEKEGDEYKVKTGKKEDAEAADEADEDEEGDEVLSEAEVRKKQERTFLRGKSELVDVILDYGDTLSTLDAGSWFVIEGFMRDSEYFEAKGFTRLVLKAKIDDIRAYGTGKITEDEMIRRIVELKF